ncbi:MAG: DNA polymerase III subunit beta [Mesorhizobium sp.]|nr:MAG: DNA polymerase III subunit beta [Mesorhizobium sp.]
MRVILERSNLLKSLNHVHRVVERRNTIPILSNVLLSAEGASLEMKATDLDLEVTEATPAKVERGGATTVPAHLLYDIVRKLADGAEVMLKTDEDGNAMTVTSGRSSFRLQCLPQSDFPELSAGSFSHIFRLDSVALKGLIEKTQFAISTEETRYYLNGIYLHTHEVGGKLKLRSVATDGHRLARAEIDAPAGSEGMPGIIIPRKTVSELQKLVDDPDVAVTTEELSADYSSDPIEIGFNAKYLLDVAAQLTGTEAKFMLADAGSPTLIHDMADETALYVLMPMRV